MITVGIRLPAVVDDGRLMGSVSRADLCESLPWIRQRSQTLRPAAGTPRSAQSSLAVGRLGNLTSVDDRA
jgi:hypothetical protein